MKSDVQQGEPVDKNKMKNLYSRGSQQHGFENFILNIKSVSASSKMGHQQLHMFIWALLE